MIINGNEHIQVINNYVKEFIQRVNSIPCDELEEQFKEVLGHHKDYRKFSFEEKVDLIKNDFLSLIWVIRDRYESVVENRVQWSVNSEDFNKALQVIVEPMKEGDLFFYSNALKDYRKGQQKNRHIFKKGTKFPKDIVGDLEMQPILEGDIPL